jgi:hypothetical protein
MIGLSRLSRDHTQDTQICAGSCAAQKAGYLKATLECRIESRLAGSATGLLKLKRCPSGAWQTARETVSAKLARSRRGVCPRPEHSVIKGSGPLALCYRFQRRPAAHDRVRFGSLADKTSPAQIHLCPLWSKSGHSGAVTPTRPSFAGVQNLTKFCEGSLSLPRETRFGSRGWLSTIRAIRPRPGRARVTAGAHSMLAFALRRRERRAEAQWVHVLPE